MPALAQPTSTVDDALRLVREVYSLMGDGTPIQIGKQYLAEPGPAQRPPRIVLVAEEPGKLGPPIKGNAEMAGSWEHACQAHVFAAETGADDDRFTNVHALADRLLNVVKHLDPAHMKIAPGNPRDASPLSVDAYGAAVSFSFTYARDIPNDLRVLAAIKQLTARGVVDPDRPTGGTSETLVPVLTEDPQR